MSDGSFGRRLRRLLKAGPPPSADNDEADGRLVRRVAGPLALANFRANTWRSWNSSGSSGALSQHATDASTRIYDGFATVHARYDNPRLQMSDPVFTMGSCFAREIEVALIRAGGNVVSVDDTIDRPEFHDALGRTRPGFFHRFTPQSMLQEFQQAFGELPTWSDNTLVFPAGDGVVADLNYCLVEGADYSPPAVATRRAIARELVRQAARARVVILTLGLIEAWFHKPTGFYVNAPNAGSLARRADEFEFRLSTVDGALACLEEIRSLLHRHHIDGGFEIVITVSPVPMSATFTDKDILIANADSKSTLRAAAAIFAERHERVHYFPSYEMTAYSAPDLAWRPDRLHVGREMVRRIVAAFMDTYYDRDAPGAAAVASADEPL